ncbi:MAG: DUF2892 domain-containing protein [Haloarculaceae archaeon]
MEKNVGGNDRVARLVLGPVLVIVAIAGYAGLVSLAVGPVPAALSAVVLGLIGVVFLVTGYTQKCVLNSVLGLDTYRGDRGRPSS